MHGHINLKENFRFAEIKVEESQEAVLNKQVANVP
jgi:hypothetical protein